MIEPAERKGQTFDLGDELTVGPGRRAAASPSPTTPSSRSSTPGSSAGTGRLYVEDLGSTNGTFLNQKPVRSPVALRKGDRLQVGKTVMELSR